MLSLENLQIISTISWFGFILVFLAGLAMAFNPRSLMIVPVMMGYIAGPVETRSYKRTLAFICGMTVADIALGILFAFIGNGVAAIFGPRWELLIGLVLIVLGLRWLNIIRFRTIGRDIKTKKVGSMLGAFALGIPFSMSFCPFCAPILLSILTIAAATGKVWYSAVLMIFFSLGRGLPILIGGLAIAGLKHADSAQRYISVFEKAGGTILIILGVFYLYNFSRYLTVL